jgi:DNA-binding XRE family transcriptional regulator
MRSTKQKKLNKAGWKVGTVQDFLELSDQEMALIEMKRALIKKIKEVRKTNNITQLTLAKMLQSSQSRVAKLETGEAGISLDLICKALLALGVSQIEIGRAMGKGNGLK